MAGNKTIPIILSPGIVVGSGSLDENGLFVGEIEDPEMVKKIFGSNIQSVSFQVNSGGER